MLITDRVDLIRTVTVTFHNEEENERDNAHVQTLTDMGVTKDEGRYICLVRKSRRTHH